MTIVTTLKEIFLWSNKMILKTRLTLGQINTIRKTAEARELEQAKDLEFVKTMYGQPPADQAGTL